MKKFFPVLFAFMLALSLPTMALATGGGGGNGGGGGGGNGSGGGKGGGADAPLVVSSASIEDGAQIASDEAITLVFSKNVCEASVRDANMELVSVTDASGNAVEAVVTLADDQVEPDKKNDMVISFDQPLSAGGYTLTVQAGVTSKSGDVLAEDYVLAFSVAAPEAPASAAPASQEPASTSAPSTDSAQQSGPNTTLFIVIGIVVVAVIAGAVALIKKRK